MRARRSDTAEQATVRAWLGDILRKHRLKPSQLAQRINVSHTTLTRFLNSKDAQFVLSVRTIAAIMRELKVDSPKLGARVVAPMGKPAETTIPVTEFKAQCLAVIDRVSRGKAGRVVLTKRGKPVAALVSISKALPNPRGALKGTVFIPPGVDITEPTGEEWEANR